MKPKTKAKSTEESAPSASPATPAALVSVIRIAGADYKAGDTATIDRVKVIVEGKKSLKASAKSGLTSGIYPVVSTMLGDRKAHRTVVDGKLFPIRSYGTAKESVAKNREGHKRVTTYAQPSVEGKRHGNLSAAAEQLLGRYLALEPSVDRSAYLSDLVVTHITPEIKRLEATQEAIHALPHDLLAKLASVDETTRAKVLAMLSGK